MLPDAPGESLTTVVTELLPGAEAPARPNAGTVFAIVLAGTVRLQQASGPAVDCHSGDSWTEAPTKGRLRIINPSASQPARLLAVFVAPTGSMSVAAQ